MFFGGTAHRRMAIDPSDLRVGNTSIKCIAETVKYILNGGCEADR